VFKLSPFFIRQLLGPHFRTRAEQQAVFFLGNEAAGAEIADQAAVGRRAARFRAHEPAELCSPDRSRD